MQRLQTFCSILLSLALIAACGSDDKKKNQSQTPQEKNPDDPNKLEDPQTKDPDGPVAKSITSVLVFMGGYTSCIDANKGPDNMDLSDMFTRTQEQMDEKFADQTSVFFLSCYGLDPNTATYLTSKPNAKKQTRSVANMEKDLAQFVSTIENPALFIAGHSYGAYTALKMLQTTDKKIDVRALVTIDAISKVGCTPASALAAFLNNTPTPQGCREAPSDLSAADLQAIKSRVGTWVNFYQTDSPLLHSGPITPAQNTKRTYDSTGFGPHNDLVFDEEAIEEVATALAKAAE